MKNYSDGACSTSHSGANLVDGSPPALILKQLQLVAPRPGPAPIDKFEVEKLKLFRNLTITSAARSNQVSDYIVMLLLAIVST